MDRLTRSCDSPPARGALLQGSLTDPQNFEQPDVVLIQAPGWGVSTPPLALALLAAYLRDNGLTVLPLDLNLECYLGRRLEHRDVWELDQSIGFWDNEARVNELIRTHRALLDTFAEIVVSSGAPLVGFTIYNSSLPVSLHLARRIKESRPSTVIAFGGPHASRFMAGQAIAQQPFVDIVVEGEGELTLLDLAHRVKRGDSLDGCEGTMVARDGQVVVAPDRAPIKDLGSLPFADFSDYAIEKYKEPFKLPVMTSRGCVNRCIYCNERAFWRKYRTLGSERVFAEIRAQLRAHPTVRFIDFQDSLVNGNMRELERLADLIVESGLSFRWAGQAVIRKELTYPLLLKLRRSGCQCLAFGLESTSASVLERAGKILARGCELERIVRDCHRAGLECAYNFMFGIPGETQADADATLDFLARNRAYISTVNPSPAMCAFCPGTPGYEDPAAHGIDVRMGPDYWETLDGENTYPVRLARFEAFCRRVKELGIRTTYPSPVHLQRDLLLGEHSLARGRHGEAAAHLRAWLETHPDDGAAARLYLEACRRVGAAPQLPSAHREAGRRFAKLLPGSCWKPLRRLRRLLASCLPFDTGRGD